MYYLQLSKACPTVAQKNCGVFGQEESARRGDSLAGKKNCCGAEGSRQFDVVAAIAAAVAAAAACHCCRVFGLAP